MCTNDIIQELVDLGALEIIELPDPNSDIITVTVFTHPEQEPHYVLVSPALAEVLRPFALDRGW